MSGKSGRRGGERGLTSRNRMALLPAGMNYSQDPGRPGSAQILTLRLSEPILGHKKHSRSSSVGVRAAKTVDAVGMGCSAGLYGPEGADCR